MGRPRVGGPHPAEPVGLLRRGGRAGAREEYCLYEEPITETGYDCPDDLQNAIEFEDHTVCTRQSEIPESHHDPLREEFDRLDEEPPSNEQDQVSNDPESEPSELPGGVWDAEEGWEAIEALCTHRDHYDGEEVAFDFELTDDVSSGVDIGCDPDAGSLVV